MNKSFPTDVGWLLGQIRLETAGLSMSLEEQQRYRDGLEPILEQCNRVVKLVGYLRKAARTRQKKFDYELKIRLHAPEKRKAPVVLRGSYPALP